MTRKWTNGTWGGAGRSDRFDAQSAPDGHWFRLRETWINNPDSPYFDLPQLWRDAIKNPGVRQTVEWEQGFGLGSKCSRFAVYDPQKRMILSDDACPRAYNHHLFDTCWMCGQYG